MALETRWFLSKLGQASKMPEWGGKRGFAPVAFNHAKLLQVGVWTGNLPVFASGSSLIAVTVDDALLAPAEVAKVWLGLKQAPDAEVFDMRTGMSTKANAWSRKAAFLAKLEEHLVDTGGKMNAANNSVRGLVRELARTMMFQRLLGRLMPQASMDAKLVDAMPKVSVDQMLLLLEERGFPTNKMPNRNANLRAFYRTALAEPFTDFGLESGTFHLGRKEANLKKQAQQAVGMGADGA